MLAGLSPLLPGVLLLTATAGLVVSDFVGFRPGRYVFKPLAAAAFICLALAIGAIGSDYGRWLLALSTAPA